MNVNEARQLEAPQAIAERVITVIGLAAINVFRFPFIASEIGKRCPKVFAAPGNIEAGLIQLASITKHGPHCLKTGETIALNSRFEVNASRFKLFRDAARRMAGSCEAGIIRHAKGLRVPPLAHGKDALRNFRHGQAKTRVVIAGPVRRDFIQHKNAITRKPLIADVGTGRGSEK
ncbi:Hypothetical protein RMHFA_05677 [Roseomonas mucosa]|nr:Hypothetical protein RMHFA_05677 [Roseomonas mucosa]